MRGWVVVALAISLIGVLGCGRSQTPMSMAGFRDAYVAELRKEAPKAGVNVVADDTVEVTFGPGRAATAYLNNAYAFYRQDPGQLDAVLKRYVAQALAVRHEEPVTIAQLRVLVRPRSYLPPGAAPDEGPLYRPLAGDLITLVAVDQQTSYAFLSAPRLRDALKLNDEAIWERALRNTDRDLPGVPPDAGKKAIATFTTAKGLAASLLAEPRWDGSELQANGPPVVAPVAKDMVVLTRLGDVGAIAALRRVAAATAKDPDGLTDQLFVRRNGAWQVLPP
jgi:hypothetical protein